MFDYWLVESTVSVDTALQSSSSRYNV